MLYLAGSDIIQWKIIAPNGIWISKFLFWVWGKSLWWLFGKSYASKFTKSVLILINYLTLFTGKQQNVVIFEGGWYFLYTHCIYAPLLRCNNTSNKCSQDFFQEYLDVCEQKYKPNSICLDLLWTKTYHFRLN